MKTTVLLSMLLTLLTFNGMAQPKYTQKSGNSSLSSEPTGLDPNYKHQAGKLSTSSNHLVIKEENNSNAPDRNYKHQAGHRRAKEENVLTIKSENGAKRDENYKHQFSSR